MKQKQKEKEYKATVICPTCNEKYECHTTDENIIKNPVNCFMCFMAKGNVK